MARDGVTMTVVLHLARYFCVRFISKCSILTNAKITGKIIDAHVAILPNIDKVLNVLWLTRAISTSRVDLKFVQVTKESSMIKAMIINRLLRSYCRRFTRRL